MRACCSKSYEETLRPAYHRAAWSFTLALQGRRPQHGPSGSPDELSRKERLLFKTKPRLSASFAVCEFRGDWKYQLQCWNLQRHWARKHICHKCDATKSLKFGPPVFSSFGHNWKRFSNAEAIVHSMGPAPNPMLFIPGFHITLVRLG